MKKKLLSFLLAAAMLLTTQGIPTMADSVTGGNEMDETGEAAPANPVHHCTGERGGSDCTKWSYVYFGNYPQTEVTGDALTVEITGANYDDNGDAWVNGTKYRRASSSDANDTGYFGDSEYRYFKWERIKWRVLENNGSTLFVVADQGLDCKDYNETSITWENCTLRTWLNGMFYNTAFSSSEQGAIVQQTVVNDDNPHYGTSGGNNTQDNVYLLSIAEVTNPEYGFCESYSTYSASRWMQPSDYAHAMGAYTISSSTTGGNANCWWWLRSPGGDIYPYYAAIAQSVGDVPCRAGYRVDANIGAVVPALQINLSSDLWSAADDGTSGEGGGSGQNNPTNPPANPVHHCTGERGGSDYTDWSYVYFGSYPQTEVIGAALTTAITGADYDDNGDAWVNGIRYHRASSRDAIDKYGCNFGNRIYRYFKWEHIKWRVLENNGSTLFIVADQGLDCKDYDETYTSSTWEKCTLRAWLNGTFYNTAFSSSEQGAIVQQTVVNDDNPDYGTESGKNTQDNVYLLSIAEVTNPEYGFCENEEVLSASRWMQASDYAYAMGALAYGAGSDRNCTGGNANFNWWLRSPGNSSWGNGTWAADVFAYGTVNRNGYAVNPINKVVVPALQINLSSDLWHTSNDGTSGEGGGSGTGNGSGESAENGTGNNANDKNSGTEGNNIANNNVIGNQNNQTTPIEQHHKLKEKSKGICQQVPFFMLKYRQGCI